MAVFKLKQNSHCFAAFDIEVGSGGHCFTKTQCLGSKSGHRWVGADCYGSITEGAAGQCASCAAAAHGGDSDSVIRAGKRCLIGSNKN